RRRRPDRQPPRPLCHHRAAPPWRRRGPPPAPRAQPMARRPPPTTSPLPVEARSCPGARPETGRELATASALGTGAAPTDDDGAGIAGRRFGSRLTMGTARATDLAALQAALTASGTELTTVAMRRFSAAGRNSVFTMLQELGIQVLPNTSGCYSARDA